MQGKKYKHKIIKTNYICILSVCIGIIISEDLCTSDPCGPNSRDCNVLSDPVCTCNDYYTYKPGKGCVGKLTLEEDKKFEPSPLASQHSQPKDEGLKPDMIA